MLLIEINNKTLKSCVSLPQKEVNFYATNDIFSCKAKYLFYLLCAAREYKIIFKLLFFFNFFIYFLIKYKYHLKKF